MSYALRILMMGGLGLAAFTQTACNTVQRALSRTLANSAVAVHPVAGEGTTGWPEWVGEWVLLRA